MRKTTISLILLSIIIMVSCNGKHDARISTALSLAGSGRGDSALAILNEINRDELSENDDALYCLSYTMAQDKSGIDVDNDSLIRCAYTYYNSKPNDSLYDKCQYYMGKYYALNDSTEKALDCFNKAIASAQKAKNRKIEAMALLQSSVICREYAPCKAVKQAISVVEIYNTLKGNTRNKVYALLNLAESLFYRDGDSQTAFKIASEAIVLARRSKDSTTIADAYQDISVLYSMCGNKDLSLQAAKTSCKFSKEQAPSALLNIAQAYYDADSISQAKSILRKFPAKDYESFEIPIYSLLRDIAMKEHSYGEAGQLMDSLEVSLERENADKSKTKDTYYSKLIQIRTAQAIAKNKSVWMSRLIALIVIFLLSVILILAVLFIQFKKERLINFRSRRYCMLLK